MWQILEQFEARAAANLHHEKMPTLVEELRHPLKRKSRCCRAQFTGPHTDKGERRCGLVVFDDREAIALATGLPEPLDWRMQKAFPGVGPHGIAE